MKVLIEKVKAIPCRSAWSKGVRLYALEILEELDENGVIPSDLAGKGGEKIALNGARNWKEFSEGGCALIYDKDIADRLCTPSELKKVTAKKDGSLLPPNREESWLQCQSRALWQAWVLIANTLREMKGGV